MSSSLQSRKEELLAKKARLAELKRQRELREERFSAGRQSIGGESSPRRTVEDRRSEIDNIVSSLIDRQRDSTSSPSRSRPSSFYGEATPQNGEQIAPQKSTMVSSSTQTAVAESGDIVREVVLTPPLQKPEPEYITYTKGTQTDPVTDIGVNTEDDFEPEIDARSRRRSSRKQKEIDEEIRTNLRKEIEEELRATQNGPANIAPSATVRFPLRQLNANELNAVTSSNDFQAFVERSSKVIERALDEEYDLLADYTRAAAVDTEEDYANKSSQSLREVLQLYSANHSKRRVVTDLHFSPHFPELLLTSYTKNAAAPNEPNGLVLLWNSHAPSRPEYTFNATSDVLTARFSPFHPNLIIGGCYSGQVCIWDTRSSHRDGQPERRTPPAGTTSLGHTHPIYALNVVGTPNAHNILTADTDGTVCSWSVDMLSQPQEYLALSTPSSAGTMTDDLAPKSMSFPTADPTSFLVGSEEGTIYGCHRYDRAGAKAGVDSRVAYRGHTAPIMSTHYHPERGPVDLGDLMLSSSADWTVKLWRTRAAAAPGSAIKTHQVLNTDTGAARGMNDSTSTAEAIPPILDLSMEDIVYDAKWSPNKPSVFAAVTGAGDLEVFDLLSDIEVPVVKATPSKTRLPNNGLVLPFKGLNKLAWEERHGKQIAVGGLDGVVSLFEVGRGLWCGPGEADAREWQRMKQLMGKLEP
ncbi:hypothetical protein LTR05_005350 [Lithohypha guttulata]|uniref:Dynein intermediate chain n=1 Tax=Lithohypha guttulata TaxID=1690604 RepID=A0AAN7SXK9_9EURO|nr:hypothetical protein LTR05_005350 [Lithohypha guttulata]